MRYWNIINSYRSITASCSCQINSASASNVDSEIKISIKQNQMDDDLNSLNSLLLEPNSVNADLSKSMASHAESLISGMSYVASNHPSSSKASSAPNRAGNESQKDVNKDNLSHSNGSFQAANESSTPAFKSIHNKNYSSLSNSMDSLIAKHNQSIVNSAKAIQDHLKSRSNGVSGTSGQVLNKAVNESSKSQSNALDVNAIYSNELQALNNTELNASGKNSAAAGSHLNVDRARDSHDSDDDAELGSKVSSLSSSINSIFNAVASSTSPDQSNVLHFSDSSDRASNSVKSSSLNSVVDFSTPGNMGRETLDFDKIQNENTSNGAVHTKDRVNRYKNFNHKKELHGLEHHVKRIQNGHTVDKYMKNFALSIMTVILTVFLIGVVSYASTLF